MNFIQIRLMWHLFALLLFCSLSKAQTVQTSEPLHCYGYGQVLTQTQVNETMHDDYIRVSKGKIGQIFRNDDKEHHAYLKSLAF
jgi:hypothetical protein